MKDYFIYKTIKGQSKPPELYNPYIPVKTQATAVKIAKALMSESDLYGRTFVTGFDDGVPAGMVWDSEVA